MSAVFSPLPPEERLSQQQAYLAWLRTRDGRPAVANLQLSHREAYFEAIDATPLHWQGHVPHDEFNAVMKDAAALPSASPMAVWMATVAQVNEGEQFGVRKGMERYAKEGPKDDDPMVFVELEEFYHTRILVDTLRTLGAEVSIPNPRGAFLMLLLVLSTLPRFISDIFVLVAEVMGTLIFTELRRQARTLFGTESEAARRIHSLLDEILIDEVGHVSYVRSKLNPFQMFLSRAVVLVLAPVFLRMVPPARYLTDSKALIRKARTMDWSYIPADIRARAFVPHDGQPHDLKGKEAHAGLNAA